MAFSIQTHLEELAIRGFTVVPGALDERRVSTLREKIDVLQADDIERFGEHELLAMRELGTIRFPMVRDRYFLELLAHPPVIDVMDALLGSSCIVHLQNCIILQPSKQHQQAAFHQDFRPWMNGFDVSYNAFYLIDDFTQENGGTWIAPHTHASEQAPSQEFLQRYAEQVTGSAGSVILFNSRTWHRGGENRSERPRRAMNIQYTRAYIRQQVDYAHALPENEYGALPERVQQLLGRFVRLPKSVEEFRVPPEQRLHRAGQIY